MKKFKWFTIVEWEKEQNWLSEMHARGWRFEGVKFPGIYSFSRCEPEDVVYQLDYNQDSAANKGEYIRMFADCGWDYIQDYVGYSYFSKPAGAMNGEEEIFSDDRSRLAMLKRVYKRRLLPLLVLFGAVVVPQFVFHLWNGRYFLAAFMGAILLLYIAVFAYSAAFYHKQQK